MAGDLPNLILFESLWVDKRDGRRVKVMESDDSFVWVMCIADNGERISLAWCR